jgi:hypothetical protein
MYGRVSVKYCKLPTILLYHEASSLLRVLPAMAESFSEVVSGVVTGLHLDIPTCCKISEAYLSWDSDRPSSTCFTCTPRKQCSSLSSFSANSDLKSCIRAVTTCDDELATTMPSTYTSRHIVVPPFVVDEQRCVRLGEHKP